MDALIINLKRSEERMAFQASQLEQQGISFQRVEAIDANALDEATYQANAFHWERPLRQTEVACCLSHAKAWKVVLTSNKPHLILEDDALLSFKTAAILQALESHKDYDCVNLETRKRRKFVSKKKSPLLEHFKLSKLIQDKCGAAAYVLWPSGAQLLLDWLEKKGAGLADAIISLGPRLRHGQMEPAAAIQLDCCDYYGIVCPLETSTQIDHKEKPKATNPLPFRRRRILAQLKRAKRQVCALSYAASKEIKPSKDFHERHEPS